MRIINSKKMREKGRKCGKVERAKEERMYLRENIVNLLNDTKKPNGSYNGILHLYIIVGALAPFLTKPKFSNFMLTRITEIHQTLNNIINSP